MKYLIYILLSLSMFGCVNTAERKEHVMTTGKIERLHQDLNGIIPVGATIEVLAEGFTWSEGPLWLANEQKLIFSDVPENVIYQYTDKDSLKVYLTPSGYTGESTESGGSGGNGLLLDNDGNLIICQHGDRRVAKMMAPTARPEPEFETMADNFDGKRFSSPNDAVYDNHGNLYFTDPPYGLKDQDEDSAKEMAFNGVYKLTPSGVVSLLTKELSRPNGIGISPDNNKLYVSNSDPDQCLWMVYDLKIDGTIENGKVFFDATQIYNGKNGLADGLKVDASGNVFATGPGGVLVFNPKGDHLGTIKTGHATANCAFNEDESVLFMTAHNYLMRINLKMNNE